MKNSHINENGFKKYLIDTIDLLTIQAKEAKKNANDLDINLKNYCEGLIMGYYSVITLLKQQAFAFCMDQKELGLAEIKPDEDLLGLHRNPDILCEEDNWAVDVMNEGKVKQYLSDTIILLKEQAIEAKKDADNSSAENKNYFGGQLMAYRSVISLMKKQALTLNIDQDEIDLADIESEKDLV